MRLIVPAAALFATTLLAGGCGSSSKSATATAPAPKVLPRAATADEWAGRVVNKVLRPLNKDLAIVSSFNTPTVRIYIASKNKTTLDLIHKRLGDLARCSTKLAVIGPPPAGAAKLRQINDHLTKACAAYEDVANKLLAATDLLSAGNKKDAARGDDAIQSVRDPSARGAQQLTVGVKIAQGVAAFRRAGLQPSV
jgi:hypothetical protein